MEALQSPYVGLRMPDLEGGFRTHFQKLQVLQSKCTRIANKRQLGTLVTGALHEDLGIPFFVDHLRALIESFDSELVSAGDS
jgi:hypothetical protein